jgi:uncharacterized membrane protein
LFEGLGLYSSPYSTSSYALGVSADGSTVVGAVYSSDETDSLGFKWTPPTGMTTLQPTTVPGATSFVASAISAGGIVGYSQLSAALIALAWSGSTEYDLADLSGNGSSASAVSDSGAIAGFAYNSSNAKRAVRWTGLGATPVALDAGGTYTYSEAYGISSDGSVIVGDSSSGAFRWTLAGMAILPGTSTYAKGVSADGRVTVGYSNNSPVSWSVEVGSRSLGTGEGQAWAVNSDGTVIVGSTPSGAFVWDGANGRRLLASVLASAGANLTGWALNNARGVSSDGKVIVGDGGHGGTNEAWIARLP